MRTLIFILALILSLPAFADATQLKKDYRDIFSAISAFKEDMPIDMQTQLTRLFVKYADKYSMDPRISVAIAMQESSMNTTKLGVNMRGQVVDIGLFQLNVHTIAYYDMDLQRLNSDLDYQFDMHFWLLKKKMSECEGKFRRTGQRGLPSWTCYHSKTPSKAKAYVNSVSKHLSNLLEGRENGKK